VPLAPEMWCPNLTAILTLSKNIMGKLNVNIDRNKKNIPKLNGNIDCNKKNNTQT
jgi:hypothetical protein